MRRKRGRGGMRRPRARLVPSHPGGLGQPSGPTMGICLEWLDAVRMKAGESRPDRGPRRASSAPGSTAPGTEKPRVERREAPLRSQRRGHASHQGVSGGSPAAREVSQTSAFPGAPLPSFGSVEERMTACPGPAKNTGDESRLRFFFPSPLVGEGAERTKRARRVRGSSRTPHPLTRLAHRSARSTLSHKGRG
jgi:hypothetical protein